MQKLSEEIQLFIDQYSDLSIEKAALSLAKTKLPRNFILNQLAGRQKARSKIPSWLANKEVIYPAKLAMEQCSSEITAKYKADKYRGSSMIDLSAGMGVDSYFFSFVFKQLTVVEPQQELLDITKHNFNVLGIKNIVYVCEEAEAFMRNTAEVVDLIYVDPSRRDAGNSRKYQLEDCSPDIISLNNDLLAGCKRLLVKTSPFLDIQQTLIKLGSVKKVMIIAVDNECKEVLYELSHEKSSRTAVEAVNFSKKVKQLFNFDLETESSYSVQYSDPLRYLYEPNAAILKSGAFKSVAQSFNIFKLHSNTHLYTSVQLLADFPGKIFEVIETGAYQSKFTGNFPGNQAIITLRNFPDNIHQIKKKLKLKEGGGHYLIATTSTSGKPVLICAKRIENR